LLHRSGRTGRAGKKGVSVLLVSYTRRRKVELMLQSASIKAEWSGPPSAEMILENDRKRMLADPVLTAAVEDEDMLALGRQLLEKSTPEQVAAALIRLYQQKLPAPEDVYDDDRMKRQQETGKNDKGQADVPYTDFARGGDMTWYRINIGRDKNADPKWLMPTICRLGHVTKRDIGSIKIFERETKFEITQEMRAKFEAAIALGLEDGVKIDPAIKPGPSEKPVSRWDKKPAGGDRPDKKPWKAREEGGDKPVWKPREDRPEGAKKPWVKRDDAAPAAEGKKPWVKREESGDKPAWKAREDRPQGEKKPWVKRDDAAATPVAEGKKPWVKRTPNDPTPEGKKPWVKKPAAEGKTPWTPRSDAESAPAAGGDKAWKGKPHGKPQGGDRPWAAKDARGKPAAPRAPYKGKTPR
ncbi:MAG: DbpA RNA binding domain-containing protein, partial [Brevundimonas sp.]|nr:DbpA RNA binding domain-containing protein [Brevundimonas sp.]